MRRALIAVLTLAALMLPLIAESTEAARPSDADIEPVVLCYYNSGLPNLVTTYYACPDMPVGSANIPEPSGAIHYWVRMDTGEVVTASTVFSPGTYMIKGYTTAPEPWGPAPEETSGGSSVDLAVIALVVGIIDAVGIGYLIIRRR